MTTDNSFLEEILKDKLLSKYSYIVLDEAHERTVNTDILMSLIKDVAKQR